jgi:hypothetical protein
MREPELKQTKEPLAPERRIFRNRQPRHIQEEELASRKLINQRKLEGSNGRIYIADVEGSGKAILKQPKYSDIQCEVAAYIVSDIVGFDFIPATVVRDVKDQQWSAQQFIEDTSLISDVDEAKYKDDFYKLWIFDHIIRSNDRGEWNILFKDDKLIAIDHEAAFYSQDKESDYDTFKTFYGEECPEKVKAIFQNFLNNPRGISDLRTDLSGLLDPKDVEETCARIQHVGKLLLEQGKINSVEELVLKK